MKQRNPIRIHIKELRDRPHGFRLWLNPVANGWIWVVADKRDRPVFQHKSHPLRTQEEAVKRLFEFMRELHYA